MFDQTSRYASLGTGQVAMPDGRTVTFVQRRLLPQANTLTILATASLNEGERLDLFSARVLGDPLLYWRICDANDAMDPQDVASQGVALAVPLPTS
jgi:hypothetical protein